jgi:AraC-like DNA-binding protein
MKHTPKFQETPIKFSELTRLEKLADNYIHLGEDYILTKMTSSNAKFEEPVARRFDGMTICACVKGVLRMMINDTEVTVNPDSLLFIHPDAVFNSIDWSGDEQEAYLLFLSNRFIHDINIDLNAINTNLFTTGRYVIPLDKEKIIHLLRYFEMLHLNASQQNNYNRYIARALVSAAGYQIMAFAEEASENDELASKQSRKFAYAQKFLRLVREFYRSQRSISFYAEKMFISPKYLSLVIKEATGKSAGDWIDQYVIQEAKNQLRFSGKNVQQIAYDLNFSNQSSFGKYFKNLTGMSPTAFQNKDGMR